MRASVAVIGVLVVATLALSPVTTYDTGVAPRTAGIDAADDPNAIVGLDVPAGEGDPVSGTLVTLTNGFDGTRTFDIRLLNNTVDYDLSAPGDTAGSADLVTVTLASGDSVTVSYECSMGNSCANDPPSGLLFEVTATRPGVYATMTRDRAINDSGGGGGPPCGTPPCGGGP